MSKIQTKKRHPIKKSQIARINNGLSDEIGPAAELFASKQIEFVSTSGTIQIYLIDKKPLVLEREGRLFPTLVGALERPFPQRRVTIDMGAIPYVINGADIMRPGVVQVTDDVCKDRPVQIVDETHGKPLALGIALYDATDLRSCTSGKVIKTFHYIGDDLWNLEI